MRSEGTSRTYGRKDVQRDLHRQFSDTEDEHERRRRSNLVEVVQAVDGESKALTGRKKHMYAIEAGIQESELFPPERTVLNIGDPWQTLDEPGVTTMDYETGEEAQFAKDPERFLDTTLVRLIEDLQNFVDTHRPHEPAICGTAEKLIADYHRMTHPLSVDDLPRLAFWCTPLQEHIRERTAGTNDDAPYGRGTDPVRDLWYTVESLRTGLLDAHLMKTVIEPKLEKELSSGGIVSDVEQEAFIAQQVREHRFQKKNTRAEFVHATFPDVPFDDYTFDRVVASWSVSTHLFPVLTHEQFTVYWDELDRILKSDGTAYLWPVYGGNNVTLRSSLIEYVSRGGAAAIIIDGDVQWISELSYADFNNGTLVIFPIRAPQEAIQRFLASVVSTSEDEDRQMAV
jgi:hypothetical protein